MQSRCGLKLLLILVLILVAPSNWAQAAESERIKELSVLAASNVDEVGERTFLRSTCSSSVYENIGSSLIFALLITGLCWAVFFTFHQHLERKTGWFRWLVSGILATTALAGAFVGAGAVLQLNDCEIVEFTESDEKVKNQEVKEQF